MTGSFRPIAFRASLSSASSVVQAVGHVVVAIANALDLELEVAGSSLDEQVVVAIAPPAYPRKTIRTTQHTLTQAGCLSRVRCVDADLPRLSVCYVLPRSVIYLQTLHVLYIK